MMSTEKSTKELKERLQSLDSTMKTLKISLKKSSSPGQKEISRLVKQLIKLLSTAYANNGVAKGISATIHDRNLKTPPVLMMSLPSEELLETLWENEEILGNILSSLEGMIE